MPLPRRLVRAILRSELSRGALKCPACQTPAATLPDHPDGILTCPHCGHRASVAEHRAANHPGPGHGDPDRPPPDTPIRESAPDPATRVWRIPASGTSGGMLFFGSFWTAITALVSGGFLMATLQGQDTDGDIPEWALIPFFLLFWSVGLGFLYFGFRNKYATQEITLTATELSHRRNFGRSSQVRSLPRQEIHSISQVVFYTQNYTPVHGIEIRAAHGKIRFGSVLKDEEKAWLTAALHRAVFPQTTAPPKPPAPDPLETFSIPIPHQASQLHGAVLAIVVGLAFIAIGIFLLGDMNHHQVSEGPGLFRFIDIIFNFMSHAFRFIWLAISSIVTLSAVFIILRTVRDLRTDSRLEGDRTEISIRSFRNGRIVQQQSVPRDAVTAIRHFPAATNQPQGGHRIELLTRDRAIPISTGASTKAAREFMRNASQALGLHG